MKVLIFAAFAALCAQSVLSVDLHEHNKVVCYWNSTAFERQGNILFCNRQSLHLRKIERTLRNNFSRKSNGLLFTDILVYSVINLQDGYINNTPSFPYYTKMVILMQINMLKRHTYHLIFIIKYQV